MSVKLHRESRPKNGDVHDGPYAKQRGGENIIQCRYRVFEELATWQKEKQ